MNADLEVIFMLMFVMRRKISIPPKTIHCGRKEGAITNKNDIKAPQHYFQGYAAQN